jgi:AAA15 family ATPase/GTPase
MTAVKTITVKGFKSIRCVEDLLLCPINVLIGAIRIRVLSI